jgi:hypothetical protein
MRCLNKFFGLEHNRQPIIPSESQNDPGLPIDLAVSHEAS